MSSKQSAPDRRGPVETLLGLFTEVRAGESGSALLLTLNIFLILTAYYIIKPVREALILAYEGGAELKSYSAAGQTVLMLFIAVPAFAWLAGRLPRRRLINAVNLFFMANLVLFWLASFSFGTDVELGVVFYLWVGIFNLMVPSLFWSFANDIYSVEQGKRLFVIVAFGASSGAILGGVIAGALERLLGSVFPLLLVSAGILGLALLITNFVESRHGEAGNGHPKEPSSGSEGQGSLFQAFRLVTAKRYLLLIALLMLFLNWVNTTGEYILGRVVSEAALEQAAAEATGEKAIAALGQSKVAGFYAGFYTIVNLTGVIIQLLLVSRIIKYAGVPRALLFLPVISLLGYSFMSFLPVLAIIRIAKIAENATDYSLQNTVRQALFLPTTHEEKYKAKQAIDTVFVRAGDLLSAGLVFVGAELLSLNTQGFAMVNLVLVLVWLVVAVGIGREYRRQAHEEPATGSV